MRVRLLRTLGVAIMSSPDRLAALGTHGAGNSHSNTAFQTYRVREVSYV